MLKIKSLLILVLLSVVELMNASPYYIFIEAPYTFSPMNFKNATSNNIIINNDGFDSAWNERYQLASKNSLGAKVGGGYLFTPLFSKNIVASNAIELSLNYMDTSYNATRQEWGNAAAETPPFELFYTTPFTIKQSRINLLTDYVLFFKPFAQNFSLSVNGGLGLSSYKYSGSDAHPDAIVVNENFNKTGVNIISDLGFSLNYKFHDHYTVSAGYDALIYWLPETIHPSWTTDSPDAAAPVAGAQNSVALEGKQFTNQLFLRFAYQF